MGCQKWLRLCAHIFLTYFWWSRWCVTYQFIPRRQISILIKVSQFINRACVSLQFMKFEKIVTYCFSKIHESQQKQHKVYKLRHLQSINPQYGYRNGNFQILSAKDNKCFLPFLNLAYQNNVYIDILRATLPFDSLT